MHCKLGVPISDLAVGSQRAVELVLDCVPPFASLVEWVHQRERVERVVPQIPLVTLSAHLVIGLARQRHVVGELSEVLEHEVLIGGLFETHGF